MKIIWQARCRLHLILSAREEASEKIIKIKEVIRPNPEWVKVYDAMYPIYVDMYKQLDGELMKMKDIRDI